MLFRWKSNGTKEFGINYKLKVIQNVSVRQILKYFSRSSSDNRII